MIRLRRAAPTEVAGRAGRPRRAGRRGLDGVLRVGADDPSPSRRPSSGRSSAPVPTIVEVADERPSLEQIYFEVMGVRPGADGSRTVPDARRDRLDRSSAASGSEPLRNRLLMSTILVPPVLLTVAPIFLAGRGRRLSAAARARRRRSSASDPSGRRFTPAELAGAFAVQQFLVFFLLMPAYIPLSIATFSIIGEKQAGRSSRSSPRRSGRSSCWPARRSPRSSPACSPAG